MSLVTGIVIYSGLKAYVYLKVTGNLDDMIKMAAPFVTLSYGEINSDLRGKLSVKNIQVTPMGTALTYNVGEIEVEGPNLGFLLKLSGGFKGQQEPPGYVSLKVKRAEMPYGEDIMTTLHQISGMVAAKKAGYIPQACTLGGIFQHVGMENIGYGRLFVDLTVGYKYYKKSGEMAFSTNYHVDGLETVEMNMVLKGMPQLGAGMMESISSIGRIAANYRTEPAYMRGMVDYCAKQSKVTPQEYIDWLLNQSDSYYARNLGFIPGDGIKSAMKTLITNGGELRFNAYPTTKISSQTMTVYSPKDLISLMGVHMSVNGQNVSDMSFTVPESLSAYADDSNQGKAIGVSREEKWEKLKPKRLIKTELSELKKYISKSVRFYMKEDGRVMQGILDSIDKDIASVQQRVHGGKFTSHIQLSSVKRAEVWRRE